MKEVRHIQSKVILSDAERERISSFPPKQRKMILFSAENRIMQINLLKRGVPYTIASECVPPHGIIGDYSNHFLPPHMLASIPLSDETRLREALRDTPTYTEYLLDRFPSTLRPHRDKMQRARQAVILSAITDFPNVQPLNDIVTTFHEMADGTLSEQDVRKIQKLYNKAYILIYGEERAALAGIPIDND